MLDPLEKLRDRRFVDCFVDEKVINFKKLNISIDYGGLRLRHKLTVGQYLHITRMGFPEVAI